MAPVPPRERNFSPWFQVVTRLMGTTEDDPLPDADPGAFAPWRARFEARFDEALAPWPDPVPLATEIDEGVAVDGYRRHRVVFDTEDTMSVPAYLLVPDDREGPGSAVLAVHGHGPGKSRICGLEPDDGPGGDYGAELARRGHLVLAPDLRCFGERLDWNPEDHYACDTNLVHQVMAGWSPLTQNLWDCARALDVLESHPLVDPSRMGVVGFSYGGTVSLFLAACDPRVSAAVVSGYFSSWAEAHKMPWNMCGSQVLPGMLGTMEHADIGALVAPRALFVETGREDPLFPVAAADRSVGRLRRVYDHLGAGDRLVHEVSDGEHQWYGRGAYGFLDRELGGGPSG
ncbi:MAG: alpha/beta hydrolase family protein [Acidimicrobiales bacterium]|jgi:acetyl esterase/lipase